KEVAHAVDEDAFGPAPAERKRQLVGLQRDGEAVCIARTAHRLQPQGQTFGIAVLAARANLRAAGDRVPRGVRPLDPGLIAHRSVRRVNPEVLDSRVSSWRHRMGLTAEENARSQIRACYDVTDKAVEIRRRSTPQTRADHWAA